MHNNMKIYINWEPVLVSEEDLFKLNKWYKFIDWILSETDDSKYKQKQANIQKINNEFEDKINTFLSKYPKREQDTFSQKLREAEKVIDWWESTYIELKSKAFWITALEFAEKVKQKSDSFISLYAKLENEKDLAILELNT